MPKAEVDLLSYKSALQIAEDTLWGTYGPGAMEAYEREGTPLPEIRRVRLGDCSTSHLEAILQNILPVLSTKTDYFFPYLAASFILSSRKESHAGNQG